MTSSFLLPNKPLLLIEGVEDCRVGSFLTSLALLNSSLALVESSLPNKLSPFPNEGAGGLGVELLSQSSLPLVDSPLSFLSAD